METLKEGKREENNNAHKVKKGQGKEVKKASFKRRNGKE